MEAVDEEARAAEERGLASHAVQGEVARVVVDDNRRRARGEAREEEVEDVRGRLARAKQDEGVDAAWEGGRG